MVEQIREMIGKKGIFTYKYQNRLLYSQYDPYKEAQNFIQKQSIKNQVITFCGADYINAVLSRQKQVALIISFEPIQLRHLTDSKKIVRIQTISELKDYLFNNKINLNETSLISWPPFLEINALLFLDYLKKIKSCLEKNTLALKTERIFSKLEKRNIEHNLIAVKEINILKKNKSGINHPALLISSGFSLKDNLSYIKKIKQHSFIFTLPSALPYLSYHGIRPDFILAVDPGYATFYHLICPDQSKRVKKLKLLTPLSITPSIKKLSSLYQLVFFNYGHALEHEIFKKTQIITAPAEGSVFFNGLRIIKQLSFKEVILIGQDFGFQNRRSHIYEGSFEKFFISQANYYQSVEQQVLLLESCKTPTTIQDQQSKIKTDISLKIYYDHFMDQQFNLKLFLPEKPFNFLNNRFAIKQADQIINHYPVLADKDNQFNIQLLKIDGNAILKRE